MTYASSASQALVKSGEIEQYAAAEGASNGSYVSFTQLLEKLQARMGGDLVAVGAGETTTRPLHVVVQQPPQVRNAVCLQLMFSINHVC